MVDKPVFFICIICHLDNPNNMLYNILSLDILSLAIVVFHDLKSLILIQKYVKVVSFVCFPAKKKVLFVEGGVVLMMEKTLYFFFLKKMEKTLYYYEIKVQRSGGSRRGRGRQIL